MKKNSLLMLLVAFVPFIGLDDAKAALYKNEDMYGELNVKDCAASIRDVGHYYMGIHGDLSFLNWKNTYKNSFESGSDKYKFEPVLGLDIFAGYKFTKNIHADIELGYIGKFSDSETEYNDNYMPEKSQFDFETFYLMVNGYYDFYCGFYAGAGVGVARVNVSVDNSVVVKESSVNVSPMGALMLGYSHRLDDRVDFDFRYRLAFFNGGDVTVWAGDAVKTEMGVVMDNSLSAGVRYRF